MQEDKIPKIFISYSWSSDALVLDLAERLVSHGVEVVLDKWDLKEGQDKYAFMERCVNDSDISRVLIICDKVYAEKADSRLGGVGDGTVIISSEIYGNVKQEKFIPIIAEKDEEGKPYVPTYIKSRIYIDFSDENTFEEQYERLLRNIYEKPQHVKPKLGKKPEWLDDEKMDFFSLKDLLKQIRGSNSESKRKACITRFQDAYLEALMPYYEKNIRVKRVYEIFVSSKPIRDIFLDFVETITENEPNYSDMLGEVFEKLYNKLTCIKSFESDAISAQENDFEFFKILIWELFICSITYLRHVEDYRAINSVLTHTYFLVDNLFGRTIKPCNYTVFRHYSRLIEENYKSEIGQKQKFTLLGDVIYNQREKRPIYSREAIAETDLFLYQVCNAYNLITDHTENYLGTYWFPSLYIYVKANPIEWTKMRSKSYCKKMELLFGVNGVEELKGVVAKCIHEQEMRYSGAFISAPAILDCIKLEEIGSVT